MKIYKTKYGNLRMIEEHKGIVKTPPKVWSSVIGVDKDGKAIYRIMSDKDAEEYIKKTNKSVFKKMKVGELRRL